MLTLSRSRHPILTDGAEALERANDLMTAIRLEVLDLETDERHDEPLSAQSGGKAGG